MNDNSVEQIIDRMIDDVSTVLNDYDNNRIVFEIAGKRYEDLMKWSKALDERVFGYQVETGKMSMSGDALPKGIVENLKMIAAKDERSISPYYGVSGGVYTYKFCPSAIGLMTKVKNEATQGEIDYRL